jgi:hypothetical protein
MALDRASIRPFLIEHGLEEMREKRGGHRGKQHMVAGAALRRWSAATEKPPTNRETD